MQYFFFIIIIIMWPYYNIDDVELLRQALQYNIARNSMIVHRKRRQGGGVNWSFFDFFRKTSKAFIIEALKQLR